jgi:uncharacterized protein HemX
MADFTPPSSYQTDEMPQSETPQEPSSRKKLVIVLGVVFAVIGIGVAGFLVAQALQSARSEEVIIEIREDGARIEQSPEPEQNSELELAPIEDDTPPEDIPS